VSLSYVNGRALVEALPGFEDSQILNHLIFANTAEFDPQLGMYRLTVNLERLSRSAPWLLTESGFSTNMGALFCVPKVKKVLKDYKTVISMACSNGGDMSIVHSKYLCGLEDPVVSHVFISGKRT